VQNFLSAASGMAVLVALIPGFARRETARRVGRAVAAAQFADLWASLR
jgi:K+-transporting ATPase A subunit